MLPRSFCKVPNKSTLSIDGSSQVTFLQTKQNKPGVTGLSRPVVAPISDAMDVFEMRRHKKYPVRDHHAHRRRLGWREMELRILPGCPRLVT